MSPRRPVAACLLSVLALGAAGCTSSGAGDAAPTPGGTPATTSSTRPAGCSGDAAPSFSGPALPYGAAATTGKDGALQVQVGAPTVSAAPAGRDGMQVVQVPVTTSVRTNGTFAIDSGQFVLTGADGKLCAAPAVNPLSDGFAALTVDEKQQGKGAVAFLVPEGLPVGTLRVRYLSAPSAGSAAAEWRTGAAAPSSSAAGTGCDGPTTTLRAKDAASYGSSVTVGDDTVSASVRAGKPARRAFTPGPTQPNDVDAVDVKLHMTAKGAPAYVDRGSYLLVDDKGRTCRSSTLGSQGETLTSALVQPGKSGDYTIVFWVPKGRPVGGLTLLQLDKPGGSTVAAAWHGSDRLAPLG
ncbi:hypothetical protein HJ588_08770 [Flexivirga sp. ID2601S]|uniref:DUF4352 domain-containing protein n=1 Tax=Flexivirga aerilata TaxID=1656889 RepID=A0A849AHM7_9MICO|nr:hypothetical protein [Flexivirga aerilata]NNG39367.1 hypothetical protein [Flexivirga aerilata]